RTTASVDWSPAPWINEFDALPAQRTPHLNSVIDEIIGNAGWAAGNNMMFVLTGEVDENKIRNAYSFDMDEEGPVLHIWYSVQQTHLAIPIVDGNDDAEESSIETEWFPEGGVTRTSSDLELYWDDAIQYVGVLFRNVQIPQGSTIDSAYIQFVAKQAGDDEISIKIYGVDSPTVDSIPETNFGVSGKPRTTASVDWSPAPWINEFDALPAQRTPHLNSVIDEIIGNAGWAAGNNMMFVLTGEVDENKIRNAYSFDMDEEGPVLHVWFSGSGSTGNKSIQSANFSTLIYPNPTEGRLYIENSSSDKFGYNIYSISGRLVGSRQNITDPRADVDLSTLTKGMYLMSITTGEITETHKIILK
ncbi:MAG: T9SS type A sorting domain-containing protein, partial [Bacteroidota bacterium]